MTDDLPLRLLHGKDRWKYFDWTTPESFLEAANRGVFVPFADAFKYENNGIMVIVKTDAGKTTLTGRFVRYARAKRLAEDAATNLFDKGTTYIYRSRLGHFSDIDPILDKEDRYSVAAIFHLRAYSGKITEGRTEEAAEQMFLTTAELKHLANEKARELAYEAYKRIPVFDVPFYEAIDMKYYAVKNILLELLKAQSF